MLLGKAASRNVDVKKKKKKKEIYSGEIYIFSNKLGKSSHKNEHQYLGQVLGLTLGKLESVAYSITSNTQEHLFSADESPKIQVNTQISL